MQCQNVSSVVDKKKKSQIVLLQKSISNVKQMVFKNLNRFHRKQKVNLLVEHQLFTFSSPDFWSDPKNEERIQRPCRHVSVRLGGVDGADGIRLLNKRGFTGE